MADLQSCPGCERVFRWGADADSEIVDRQGGNWTSCRENAFWKLTFHLNEAHPDLTTLCPRRAESGIRLTERDYWHARDHHRVCSYCGSMHPDELFAAIEAGHELGPTDKSYKVYVNLPHPDPAGQRIVSAINFDPKPGDWGHGKWVQVTDENRAALKQLGYGDGTKWVMYGENGPTIHAKFYFQHLDDAQQQRFVALYNAKRMKLGVPGRFYVLPFFMRPAEKASA